MPPKARKRQQPTINIEDYQQLFETQQPSAAERIKTEQDTAKRRRKLLDQSATLTVGPKFRDEHVTRYRGTNTRVVESESREDGTLFDSIIDDISADTIRAYDDCDVMLTEFINPESPKMISILVQDMNPEGEVDPLISRIPVPLYICLTEEQMYDIALQYGLDVHRSAFEDPADISALPITLIPCNRGSGYRHHKVGQIRPCRVEGFINEVIGRMDRLTTNNSGNWDTKEKYFQTIDFKFRVGPRNSVVVKSIRNIQRGQRTETNSRAKSGQRELTQQQREQYGDEEGMFSSENKYDYQDPQFEPEKDINENGKKTERDQVLDNIGEDGTSHAAMLEWRFQLTTHVLMSPQLQAAFVQVAGIIERPLETHGDLEPILANRAMRGHLTTLLEYEMLQGETSLRVYTDPRAQDAALKRRMYSAYCLRNNG